MESRKIIQINEKALKAKRNSHLTPSYTTTGGHSSIDATHANITNVMHLRKKSDDGVLKVRNSIEHSKVFNLK